jgi:ATP-dependent RNA helicase DDX49/DBP8
MPNVKKASSRKAQVSTTPNGQVDMILDPADVIRAMMTARKGKARVVASDEESEDDEQPTSGEGSEPASEGEDGGEVSEAELGRSQRRISARPPLALDDEDGDAGKSSSLCREPSGSTSRVQQAMRNVPAQHTAPINPFDSHEKPAASTTFASLGLSPPLINALASINIKKPTEIQAACVGPILSGMSLASTDGENTRRQRPELRFVGRDCIGGAKTGSGKTMAFALPIVERIARDPFGVWAVVLTPTR